MGALRWGLKVTLCNLRTIVYNWALLGPLGPFLRGTFCCHKMTTIVGNRGQLWTSTLSPHLLSPHLDFPVIAIVCFWCAKSSPLILEEWHLANQTKEVRFANAWVRSLKLGLRTPFACKCCGEVEKPLRNGHGESDSGLLPRWFLRMSASSLGSVFVGA